MRIFVITKQSTVKILTKHSDDSDDSVDSNSNSVDSNSNSDINNTIYYAMKKTLIIPPGEHLPPSLIADYDCSNKIIELKGLLLSKNGLVNGTHPQYDKSEHFLQFCNECLNSLLKATKILERTIPPPHAIANHFFVGQMPDNLFNDTTWVEHAMTSLVTNVASTRIVRGGARRAIRSHVMVFGAIPGPPATLLPRKLDDDAQFRVILAGPFTQPQMDRIRKQHLVRHSICKGLLDYYKENNILYNNVEFDKNLIDELPEENNPDEIFDRINDISPDIVDLIDIQQQRLNDRSTSTNISALSETMMVERTVVFIDTDVNNVTLAAKAAKEPIFTLHASNQFVNESTIAQMFPHLFPYGRGHPNESKRRVKISPFQVC